MFLIKVVVGGEGGAPYITWYRNQSTVTRVLTYISYDKTISKSECILQYRKTECYCINWKGLDGSGRGLIKHFAPKNTYTASQEAGFHFLIKQHTRQAIMVILVHSFFCFLLLFCCFL